jgi:uncharacterized protein YukE
MTIETRVDGEPESCRALARSLRDGATAASTAGDDVHKARSASTTCWGGESAELFRNRMNEVGRGSDQLAEYSVQVAQAAEVFADELTTVEVRMQQARAVALEAGLTVTGTVIGAPGPPPPPLPADPEPAAVTVHVAAVEAHQMRAAAFGEIQQTVTAARELEATAHRNLGTALGRQASFLQYNVSNAGWTAWALTSGGAGSLHGAFTKWSRLAAGRGALAQRWGGIGTHPTFPAAFREGATRYAGQLGMRAADAARHADSAARALGNIGRSELGSKALRMFSRAPGDQIVNAPPRFERLPSGTVQAARSPLLPIAKVTSKLPYVGIASTGLQVWQADREGKPVGKAAAAGVSSFVAGAAGTSLATSALVAAGMAAGPAGWVAVGAGTALAVGVGYVVENHGDEIAEFAGDAWGATLGRIF